MKCKQIWDGKKWQEVELCENACRNTDINYGNGIGVIQCYDNPVEFCVNIYYKNCVGDEFDQDIVKICGECLKELKKSAQKRDHRLESRKI